MCRYGALTLAMCLRDQVFVQRAHKAGFKPSADLQFSDLRIGSDDRWSGATITIGAYMTTTTSLTDKPINRWDMKDVLLQATRYLFTITGTVTERNAGEDWVLSRTYAKTTTKTPHQAGSLYKAVWSWCGKSKLAQVYEIPVETTDAELAELFAEYDKGFGPKGKIRMGVLDITSRAHSSHSAVRRKFMSVALLDEPTAMLFKLKHKIEDYGKW